MLRRVPRRMSNIEPHPSHADRVARSERRGAGAAQARIDSSIVSLSREEQRGARACGERLGTGEEVSVNVSLRDERDAHVLESSGSAVRTRTPARLTDHPLAPGLARE